MIFVVPEHASAQSDLFRITFNTNFPLFFQAATYFKWIVTVGQGMVHSMGSLGCFNASKFKCQCTV